MRLQSLNVFNLHPPERLFELLTGLHLCQTSLEALFGIIGVGVTPAACRARIMAGIARKGPPRRTAQSQFKRAPAQAIKCRVNGIMQPAAKTANISGFHPVHTRFAGARHGPSVSKRSRLIASARPFLGVFQKSSEVLCHDGSPVLSTIWKDIG